MRLVLTFCAALYLPCFSWGQGIPRADTIFINGIVPTVNPADQTVSGFAVKDGRFLAAGSNEHVLLRRTKSTDVIDLKGKTVIPGLIDSHVHSTGAAIYEYDHVVPPMHEMADVLAYIKKRVEIQIGI